MAYDDTIALYSVESFMVADYASANLPVYKSELGNAADTTNSAAKGFYGSGFAFVFLGRVEEEFLKIALFNL